MKLLCMFFNLLVSEFICIIFRANMYCIILFTKENKVEGVPASWINQDETHCNWPKCVSSKVAAYIKNCRMHNEPSELVPIRVLGKAETYEMMNKKLEKSRVTSDIDSGNKRHTLKRALVAEESTDEDSSSKSEEVSPPPSPPMTKKISGNTTLYLTK